MKKNFESIDEYIASFPKNVQTILEQKERERLSAQRKFYFTLLPSFVIEVENCCISHQSQRFKAVNTTRLFVADILKAER